MPKKVSTPGNHRLLPLPKLMAPAEGKTTPVKITQSKKKAKRRPFTKKNLRKTHPKMQMSSYTDLLEAVRLVKNINSAVKHINSMELNCVPRHGVMKKKVS
jgi:hypothetical protein